MWTPFFALSGTPNGHAKEIWEAVWKYMQSPTTSAERGFWAFFESLAKENGIPNSKFLELKKILYARLERLKQGSGEEWLRFIRSFEGNHLGYWRMGFTEEVSTDHYREIQKVRSLSPFRNMEIRFVRGRGEEFARADPVTFYLFVKVSLKKSVSIRHNESYALIFPRRKNFKCLDCDIVRMPD